MLAISALRRSVLAFTGLVFAVCSVHVLTASGAGSPPAHRILPADVDLASAAPDSFLAEFQTTKGAFTMKARRVWAPLGVDRLYQLVKAGYFGGMTIYRVGETKSVKGGRVVQFGQSGDTTMNHAWERATIADEPVVHPHRRGSVGFARGGPGTRSVEIAITTNAAAPLDTVNYLGVVGFPTIADVEQGLDVLDRLEGRYGNAPIENDSLSILGGSYLERVFPGLDKIQRARVTKVWGRPAAR
jgi:cyclophilin family peptidyl-prolyl cis-trans isomerase